MQSLFWLLKSLRFEKLQDYLIELSQFILNYNSFDILCINKILNKVADKFQWWRGMGGQALRNVLGNLF